MAAALKTMRDDKKAKQFAPRERRAVTTGAYRKPAIASARKRVTARQ
jgi:hypothetical protein